MERIHSIAGLLCIALLCGLLAGCGGNDSGGIIAATQTSGVQGTVRKAPIAPITLPGAANSSTYSGVFIAVQRQNGTEIARQKTDKQGRFVIGLAPGTYRVVGIAPNGDDALPRPPAPQTITVTANTFVTVNLTYDTGIR